MATAASSWAMGPNNWSLFPQSAPARVSLAMSSQEIKRLGDTSHAHQRTGEQPSVISRAHGFHAEQTAISLLETASKYQALLKLIPPQGSINAEQHVQQHSKSGHPGTPPAKRLCTWESVPPGVCLECEVKMAENQILREKISTLQDQVTALTSWFWQLFPSPLLNTATIEPPNIQHSTLKRLTPALERSSPFTVHHFPSTPYTIDQLAISARGQGRRQPADSKSSTAPPLTPSADSQQSGGSHEVMSELVSGSGVYILTQSLMEARMGARSGTQLARKLMDKFWDKVTLAKSTLGPHSKLQYQQLDPKIIKAIEAYCLQYDGTLQSEDIRATMTDKCCKARNKIRTQLPEAQKQ